MSHKVSKNLATIGRLSIEYAPRASLKRNPQNPRHHSKRQIRQIARSIEKFGFIIPLLIDDDGTIIVGQAHDWQTGNHVALSGTAFFGQTIPNHRRSGNSTFGVRQKLDESAHRICGFQL